MYQYALFLMFTHCGWWWLLLHYVQYLRIAFKHAVFVYKCLHGSVPAYLTDELCQVADVNACQRLRSSSSLSLIVCQPHPIVYRRWPSFSGCCARVWNSLPDLVTSASSIAFFRSRLKTHLFNISYPSPLWLYSARTMTLSCFGHYNRSSVLTYLLLLFAVVFSCYTMFTYYTTLYSYLLI